MFVFLFDFFQWFLTKIMCFRISTCLNATHYGFGELEACVDLYLGFSFLMSFLLGKAGHLWVFSGFFMMMRPMGEEVLADIFFPLWPPRMAGKNQANSASTQKGIFPCMSTCLTNHNQ